MIPKYLEDKFHLIKETIKDPGDDGLGMPRIERCMMVVDEKELTEQVAKSISWKRRSVD